MKLDFILSEQHRRDLEAKPQATLVTAFAAAILIGTMALMMPFANVSGAWMPPIDALATATSATCVTGLAAEPLESLTLFGRLVVMALIQLGGLGVMTLGTILVAAAGRRLSMRDESMMMSSLSTDKSRSVMSTLLRVFAFTAAFEIAGWLCLSARLASVGLPPHSALKQGLFHAISAFCNAGFAISGKCLTDAPCRVVILTLAFFGGLGFPVLDNLFAIVASKMHTKPYSIRHRCELRVRLSLHARLAIATSLALVALGWVAFAVFEWHGMLDGMPVTHRIAESLALAVNPRSSGFALSEVSQLSPPSQVATMALMFVGGSPCSTAGGIKTVTFAVLVLTMCAMARGRYSTEFKRRTIPESAVREALVIVMASLLFVGALFCTLLVTEHAKPENVFPILFETIAAYSTAGIGFGESAALSQTGKMLIVLAMFVGRIGPLSIAFTVGSKADSPLLRYPREDVAVG